MEARLDLRDRLLICGSLSVQPLPSSYIRAKSCPVSPDRILRSYSCSSITAPVSRSRANRRRKDQDSFC